MNIEYEVRILEIDKEEIIKKLEELGAKKVGYFEQKRYVYDVIPKKDDEWIRLRTNGEKTTLTYKNVVKTTIDGTNELEIVVEDFEKTNELLEKIGIFNRGYQENTRLQYILDGVEIDIDSWPMIPTYLEIEGKNESEVIAMIEKLNVEKDKITTLDVQSIYEEVYNIDITNCLELKLKN